MNSSLYTIHKQKVVQLQLATDHASLVYLTAVTNYQSKHAVSKKAINHLAFGS